MKKYFKVKVNYLKKDVNLDKENPTNVSEVRLFEAIDYVDAQKQVMERIESEGLCGECELDIQKVSYDECIYKESEKVLLKDVKENKGNLNIDALSEETYWYEIKIMMIYYDDKEVEKYSTKKYLVEGIDLEDSINTFKQFAENSTNIEDWWFTNIIETPIKEVIMLNNGIQ